MTEFALDPLRKELSELTRAILVGIYPSGGSKESCEEYLGELQRLCDTYGLSAVAKVPCSVKKLDAGTYLGSGKLEEIAQLAEQHAADLILFDDEISPRQQKNLEELFKLPVIDRTELIIAVFAQRAKTKEARLQVELAQVKYQFPRLRRLWTHLSRQKATGGGAYLKGEGEKQIELDRRMLKERIVRLEREIDEVHKQRSTQRQARRRSEVPTFAIVGYTNAGKSTLLRALTKADVLVEDKLFATLDTTSRKYLLPNKQEVVLIDTVGFIRKIPHTLVTAFKSTLEEAVHTDILLHLIDVSHPMAEEQAKATLAVLSELGVSDQPIITALNKVDALLDPKVLHRFRTLYPKTVALSALHGTGFHDLLQMMQQEISNLRKKVSLRVPQSHYALVSELQRCSHVLSCEYEGNDILLVVEIPSHLEPKVRPFLFG